MGFSALALARAARGAHPTGPPGLSRLESVGPGRWSRTPPSGSSGGNRKQSTACPPRSLGGLWAQRGLSRDSGADPASLLRAPGAHLHRCQFPSRRQRRTSRPQTSPRCLRAQGRGIAPATAAGWRPPGGAGDPLAERPMPCTPPPAPQPSAAPTLLRGRHCSRTCSGSRRLCSAMRFTRYSRSRSQAFRARLPTQVLVVYQSQYLGRQG